MADNQRTEKKTTRRKLALMVKILFVATAIAAIASAGVTAEANIYLQSVAAMEFYPGDRELNSNVLARRQQVPALLNEGENLVKRGEVLRAIATYQEAQVLSHSPLDISAGAWNTLCWFGSLWGQAPDVIDACDKAVAGSPESEEYRDSRGLARALAGDRKGAIEDFQTFVDSTKDETRKFQRQSWINALRAGQNPFTPALMKELFTD